MLLREGDAGDGGFLMCMRDVEPLLAAPGTGHLPFCWLTRLQLIPPQELPGTSLKLLSITQAPESKAQSHCSAQLSLGVIWEQRCFLAFSKENKVPNLPFAVTGGVSSFCYVQSFDPATLQDVFAELLPPESCWCICCRGKRNKAGRKWDPPAQQTRLWTLKGPEK